MFATLRSLIRNLLLNANELKRIADSLEKLTLLHEMDLRERGLILLKPSDDPKDDEVEISYGAAPVSASKPDEWDWTKDRW